MEDESGDETVSVTTLDTVRAAESVIRMVSTRVPVTDVVPEMTAPDSDSPAGS